MKQYNTWKEFWNNYFGEKEVTKEMMDNMIASTDLISDENDHWLNTEEVMELYNSNEPIKTFAYATSYDWEIYIQHKGKEYCTVVSEIEDF